MRLTKLSRQMRILLDENFPADLVVLLWVMTIIDFASMRKGSVAMVKARRHQSGWIVTLLSGAMVSASLPALAATEGGKRDDLDALYLDLHAHPELAFQEHRTSELLADRVAALGFEVTRHVGGTGSWPCSAMVPARW